MNEWMNDGWMMDNDDDWCFSSFRLLHSCRDVPTWFLDKYMDNNNNSNTLLSLIFVPRYAGGSKTTPPAGPT